LTSAAINCFAGEGNRLGEVRNGTTGRNTPLAGSGNLIIGSLE